MENALRVVVVLSLALLCLGAVDIQIPNPIPTTGVEYHSLYFANVVMGPASFTTVDSEQTSGEITGEIISSCQWDYYRLDAAAAWGTTLNPTDYLHVNASNVIFDPLDGVQEAVPNFLLYVKYTTELDDIPTPDSFDWVLEVNASLTFDLVDNFIELFPCEMRATGYYWFAINSPSFEAANNRLLYSFTVYRRRGLGPYTDQVFNAAAPVVTPLTLGTQIDVIDEYRPNPAVSVFGAQANQADQDRLRDWRYFSVDVSGVNYVPGTYIKFNVSNVRTAYDVDEFEMAVNFAGVPYYSEVALRQEDAEGLHPDSCSVDWCFESGSATSSCTCKPQEYPCGGGIHPLSRYLTCEIIVSPCFFSYGLNTADGSTGNLWYVGIRLPTAALINEPLFINSTEFSLRADVVQPTVAELTLGQPATGFANLPNAGLVLYDDAVHYHLTLTTAQVGPNTNLRVRTTFVGTAGLYQRQNILTAVRRFDGTPGTTFPDYTLAYDIDDTTPFSGCPCYPDLDFTCESCADCEIIVAKCQLSAGDWYVSVRALEGLAPLHVEVTAELYDDPLPAKLTAGVPVFGSLAPSTYDFWVIDVPATTSSWLYVELYTKKDTRYATYSTASVQLLANELPGETCFPAGDYLCQIESSSTDNCVFIVDTCHLQEGPLYLSVFSVPEAGLGYYQVPDLKYTLWAEFENPWQLLNGVTYSDYVYESQYNHYYVIAENVEAGAWWAVEIDNIQGGHINAYVNYEKLAGACPCYASLLSCEGSAAPQCTTPGCEAELSGGSNYGLPLFTYTSGFGSECCKLEVDGCSFRDGVWYVSVWGTPASPSNLNPSKRIGYTITSNVHAAPQVATLPVGTPFVDRVAPTAIDYLDDVVNQINHYQLLAVQPQASANLVLTLTWMQDNCGRVGTSYTTGAYSEEPNYYTQQLAAGERLILRLADGALALPECYDYPWSCTATTDSYSQCQIVVPYCQWSKFQDFPFVSVQYWRQGDSGPSPQRGVELASSGGLAQYTLLVTVEDEPLTVLVPGVTYYHSSPQNRYFHYMLDMDLNQYPGMKLVFDMYYNTIEQLSSRPSVSLNVGNLAGGRRGCIDCTTSAVAVRPRNYENHVSFQLDPCVIEQIGEGAWYFSVYSGYADYYTLSNEYTLEVNFEPAVTDVQLNEWTRLYTLSSSNATQYVEDPNLPGNVLDEQYYAQNHFRIVVSEDPDPTETMLVSISQFGSPTNDNPSATVWIYYNKDSMAGDCPCYSSLYGKVELVSLDNVCSTSHVLFELPPCEFTAGTYYFNVFVLIWSPDDLLSSENNLQVQVSTRTSPVADFGTLTTELAASSTGVVHLGISPYLYLDDDIEAWFTWSSAAARYLIAVSQDNSLLHYTFETTKNALVYYAVHNLENACGVNITGLEVYFVDQQGPYVPSVLGCTNETCTQPELLCSYLSSQSPDPSVPCAGSLDRCKIDVQNYLTIRAVFPANDRGEAPNERLGYLSGVASATFSLKLWYQDPFVLPANTLVNVTHYFNGPQEFRMDQVAFGGVAPITQIVFVDVAEEIYINVRPANAELCPAEGCGFAYLDECIEIRGGFSLTNDEAFGTDPVPIPNIASQLTFNYRCGTGAVDSCTVSLMPCLLRTAQSASWIVTVRKADRFSTASSSGGVLFNNAYRVFWENLGDVAASSVIAFPQQFIDARERYPGPEDTSSPEGETDVIGQDSYQFWTVDVTGLTTSFSGTNTTRDTSDYTRMEIQIYALSSDATPAVPDADWVVFIAKDTGNGIPPVLAVGAGSSGLVTLTTGGSVAEVCDDCVGPLSYVCYGGSCDGNARFVVPACCLSNGRYWIVARVLTPGDIAFRVRVRLVSENVPIFVASSQFAQTATSPDTGVFALVGLTEDASGIEPDNYIHYYTTLSTAQFFDNSVSPPIRHALIFNLTIDDDVSVTRSPGNVWLFVRRGARAGIDGIQGGVTFGANDCLQNSYSCRVTSQDDYCVIEIDSAALAADDWYFSLYNDAWYSEYATGLDDPLDADAFDNYLGYDLEIYLRPEGLNNVGGRVSAVTGDFEIGGFCLNRTEGGPAPAVLGTSGFGAYVHYSFTVSQQALDACLTGGAQDNCAFEKFLRISFYNDDRGAEDPAFDQDIQAFLSLPYTLTTSAVAFQQAGQPGNEEAGYRLVPFYLEPHYPNVVTDLATPVLAPGQDYEFDGGLCSASGTWDFVPRAGVYYVSFRMFASREYALCAELNHRFYEPLTAFTAIPSQDVFDETQSVLVGSDSYVYLPATVDEPTVFRYTFALTEAQVNDGLHYLVVNITNIIQCHNPNDENDCAALNSINPQLTATLFRTDCDAWNNDAPYQFAVPPPGVTTGFISDGLYRRAIISDVGLFPCSLESGRYYLTIENPAGFDFDLEVVLRKALQVALTVDVPVESQIWLYQFHVYSYAYSAELGRSLVATLDSGAYCGTLEMFAKWGTPAGPNPSSSVYAGLATCEECSSAYCSTDSNSTCTIFLDVCETTSLAGTYYFTVHTLEQTWDLVNFVELPITYTIVVSEVAFDFVPAGLGCPVVYSYNDTVPACSELPDEPANAQPQQFVFVNEIVSPFTQVRFVLEGTDGDAAVTDPFMVISQNRPVPFYPDTDYSTGLYTQQGCDVCSTCTVQERVFYSYGSGTCQADCSHMVGPTTFYVWIEAASEAVQVTMERWVPYVPVVNPYVLLQGSINIENAVDLVNGVTDYNGRNSPFRPNVQFYSLAAALDVQGFQVEALSNGQITVQSWNGVLDCLTKTGAAETFTGVLTLGDNEFYWFPDDATYFCVEGVSVTACPSGTCAPVYYSFLFTSDLPITSFDCGQETCVSFAANVDSATLTPTNQQSRYQINTPATIDYARDTVYDSPVFSMEVRHVLGNTYAFGYVTSGGSSNLEPAFTVNGDLSSLEQCAAGIDSFSYSTLCPAASYYFEVESTSWYASEPKTGELRLRIESECTTVSVTDVTSQVLSATGFESAVQDDELFIYSFDLSAAASLEFKNLATDLEFLCGNGVLTQSFDGPECSRTESPCALSNEVYYFTIRCTDTPCQWVFSAQLESVPSATLALGSRSTLFQLRSNQVGIYRVDVAAGDLSPDSYLQVEVLSIQANLESTTSLTAQVRGNGNTRNQLDIDSCTCGNYIETGYYSSAFGYEPTLVVDNCELAAGTYYVVVQANEQYCDDAHPTQFALRPVIRSHGVAPIALPAAGLTQQQLLYGDKFAQFNYYSVAGSANAVLAQFRLANVLGGKLTLLVAPYVASLPASSRYTGTLLDPIQGRLAYLNNTCYDCPAELSCTTVSPSDANDHIQQGCTSCTVYTSCLGARAENFYLAVYSSDGPGTQQEPYAPITYSVFGQTYDAFEAIEPGATSTAVTFSSLPAATQRTPFAFGNEEAFFYSVSTGGNVQSVRITADVSGSTPNSAITIEVYADACLTELVFTRHCGLEYSNGFCEMHIATSAAALQYSGAFYIVVTGREGTFTLTFDVGTANCELPTEDLSFCTPWINYPVWSVANQVQLDGEAQCRYEQLRWRFVQEDTDLTDCSGQVCYTGISTACDQALRQFSCYESFPPCDLSGFITSTCQGFCKQVEEVCGLSFTSVDLVHYDCSSDRYLSDNCAGDA